MSWSRDALFDGATCATTCKFFTCDICWSKFVNSWKWVAKRQNAWISDAMYLGRIVNTERFIITKKQLLWNCPSKSKAIVGGRSCRKVSRWYRVVDTKASPLPSSSMMISESFVADYMYLRVHPRASRTKILTRKMVAVSSISAIKVETPFSWLSPAPTLQRIESNTGIWASEHGTKHPIWAINAMTPTWMVSAEKSVDAVYRGKHPPIGCTLIFLPC